MKIATREEGASVVLEPKAPLVGRASEDLAAAIRQVFESQRSEITIDMKLVSLVDSAGLEELLRCTEVCASMGGRCRLVNASDKIKRILRMTRLERDLNVEGAPS